jgi:hypothetical protein
MPINTVKMAVGSASSWSRKSMVPPADEVRLYATDAGPTSRRRWSID